MDFYNIVIIITLGLLIVALVLYGLSFKSINPPLFPESQDFCPTQWVNNGGICTNPTSGSNKLPSVPSNTPGLSNVNGFDPTDPGWGTFMGAKNAICGKKAWAKANNIQWNGINTYECK